MRRTVTLTILLVFVLSAQLSWAQIPEKMSYQGLLTDASGNPVANGSYSLSFSIYNVATGGSALWSETQSVAVVNGIFNVILGSVNPLTADFSQQYWLGVTIVGAGLELTPRIQLTSSAYSLNARTVANGTVTTSKLADDAVTGPKLADNVVSTTHILGATIMGDDIANGVLVRSINLLKDDVTLAAGANVTITPSGNTLTISATGVGSGWSLTGNAGTDPVTNFLGTTDDKALELRVNGLRALCLEPHTTSPNLIGGHNANWVTSGVYGATISGGGQSGFLNRVTDHYGTVGGGGNNEASGSYSTVAGGSSNIASSASSTVGGGSSNEANGASSTVGGGWDNTAVSDYGTVGGGRHNTIFSGEYSIVGGGFSNQVSADYATIAGGGRSDPGDSTTGNRVTDIYGTVGGGGNNQAGDNDEKTYNAGYATVAGGTDNTASGHHATVGGGEGNHASAGHSTVGGGGGNDAHDASSTVGGGDSNYAGTDNGNDLDAICATVAGGWINAASGECSTVGGGEKNTASGKCATVPGGLGNTAQGECSFAGGKNAKAYHDGCFVWSDSSSDNPFPSGTSNQFVVRASGGVYIYSNSSLSTGVGLHHGANSWSEGSDRNMKRNIRQVDGKEILTRLIQIPISRWSFKSQDPSIEHIGPMAQDFYAAFGLGADDKHINTLDPDGIALSAIQGLYELVKEKDAENAALKQQVDDLEARLKALESLISPQEGVQR